MRVHTRRAAAVTAATLALLAVAATGCGSNSESGAAAPAAATQRAATETGAATSPPAVIAEGLGGATTVKPSPTRSATKAPRPRPSRKPPTETLLPPAVPKPSPSDCKPKYVGTQATRAQVKQALTDAAGRTYWPTSAPSITVPLNLVKAVAWQESGWQSNIVACDGGIGLMQLMMPTVGYVNQRFDQSYDVNNYGDNATLGANYLAWLIKYFGDVYFAGDYTLSVDGDCAANTAPCLINAVIAGYNYGYGAVDTDQGLVIPNPRYVQNVRALMTECECLAF